MPKKVQPKRRLKIYLQEHRERLKERVNEKLTQDEMAKRLGIASMTVSRWERGEVLLTTDDMAAICEAVRPEAVKLYGHTLLPEDFYHHPDEETPSQLLRDQPSEVMEAVMKMLKGFRKTT